MSRPEIRVVVGFVVASALFLGSNGLADAAFPGGNGKIIYSEYHHGKTAIYSVNSDGTNKRRLTHGKADSYSPSVSPNGKRIAFVSDRTGNDEIYLMRANGNHQRRLTKNHARDESPRFSPNGKGLLFLSERRHAGRRYCCKDQLFRMRADGSRVKVLSRKNLYAGAVSSPSGKKIVYAASGSRHRGGGIQLWVMRKDGFKEHQLTKTRGAFNYLPDFSPDGRWIVFSHEDEDPSSRFDLWLIKADGSNLHQLTDTHGKVEYDPAFSPDGTTIAYFGYFVGRMGHINLIRPDGSDQHQVRHTRNGFSPSWQPTPTR